MPQDEIAQLQKALAQVQDHCKRLQNDTNAVRAVVGDLIEQLSQQGGHPLAYIEECQRRIEERYAMVQESERTPMLASVSLLLENAVSRRG